MDQQNRDQNEDVQSATGPAPDPELTGEHESTITVSDVTVQDTPGSASATASFGRSDESTTSMPDLTVDDTSEASQAKDEDTISVSNLGSDEGELSAVSVKKSDGGSKTGFILQGRYELQQVLGQGGFGEVYLAEDLKLKRKCVVKRMLVSGRKGQALEIHRANFRREADLLVELNEPGHPNIPEIYDYFFDEDGNYLVMKYIQGQNLKQLLVNHADPLPSEDVVQYGLDLCRALHYMHTYDKQQPVLHRDIKPANILLGDDGRIWLVDFGLAKAQPVDEADRDHALSKASGSLGYTAMEQWLGEPVPTSDIYALGATLHYLLTGLNPLDTFANKSFTIPALQQAHAQFIPIHKVNHAVPKILSGIVASATVSDPEQRPTALQLQQQLDIFVSGAKDAPLFTFKTSEAAKTKAQLVDLCDTYPAEAQGYLYRGDFERWFRLINRNDLAEGAVKAVNQGRNRKDGLEKFLKFIFPNLFLRRLGRAAWNLSRVAFFVGLGGLITLAVLLVIGSSVAGWAIERSITNVEWNLDPKKAAYSDQELTTIAQERSQGVFNQFLIDIRPPQEQIEVNLNWSGILLSLTLDQLEAEPHFRLTEINGLSFSYPFDFIPENVAQGLNNGLDHIFSSEPNEIIGLELREDIIRTEDARYFQIDTVHLIRAEPTSQTSPPSSGAPARSTQPIDFDRSDGVTTLAVSNKLGQPIVLDIEGQVRHIDAGDIILIETKPGPNAYVIRDAENEVVIEQAQKIWGPGVYDLTIDWADEE